MADTANNDANQKDSRFEKLTPILEYTYVVLYNMLNTVRSMKNYVEAYARDMDLQDLEQYDAAQKALDQAVRGLTDSAKEVGAIYGLPEEMLDPQKMAQELASKMKEMQANGQLPDMANMQANAGVQASANTSSVDTAFVNTANATPSESTSKPADASVVNTSATSEASQTTSTATTSASTTSASASNTVASSTVDNTAQTQTTQAQQVQAEKSQPASTDETAKSENNEEFTPPEPRIVTGKVTVDPATQTVTETPVNTANAGTTGSTSTDNASATTANTNSATNTANTDAASSASSADSDDDEIKSILEQLKQLRNNN